MSPFPAQPGRERGRGRSADHHPQWSLPTCPLGGSGAGPSPQAQSSPRPTPGEARPLPWTSTRLWGPSVRQPLGVLERGSGCGGSIGELPPGTAPGPLQPPTCPGVGMLLGPAHRST